MAGMAALLVALLVDAVIGSLFSEVVAPGRPVPDRVVLGTEAVGTEWQERDVLSWV